MLDTHKGLSCKKMFAPRIPEFGAYIGKLASLLIKGGNLAALKVKGDLDLKGYTLKACPAQS